MRPHRLVAVAVAGLLVAGVVPNALATATATAATPTVTQPVPHREIFVGAGFDTCNTPSTATMRAWLASPYRAVNIYFAGSERACSAQAELTPQWISTVTANGWALIPTYVGLQAPCYTGSKHTFTAATARTAGTSAADDAAASMKNLGLPAGSPAYVDIEQFDTSNAHCAAAVVNYVEAWTTEMHAKGYRAGVYVPLIHGLAPIRDDADPRPDDIWYARWDHQNSTTEPALNGLWSGHRIHQYEGDHNETWSTVKLSIDNDAVHADVVGSVSPAVPDGPPYVYAASSHGTALVERTTPTTDGSPTGASYSYGTPLAIACQAVGDTVYGSYIWDKLTDGGYVSDVFTTTTGGLSFTNGIPRCDTVPPSTPTMTPLAKSSLASTVTASWSAASDASTGGSGIGSYDVRYRRASWDGGFGHWHRLPSTTKRSASVPLAVGTDTCVAARAVDRSLNAGRWATATCIARALDDRSLSASSGWSRRTGARYYLGTFTEAKQKGVQLRRRDAQVARVAVVATRCSTCGAVDVYAGRTLLGTVRLYASRTQRHWRSAYFTFALRTTTVRLVTRSGKDVQIDGLVLSRT